MKGKWSKAVVVVVVALSLGALGCSGEETGNNGGGGDGGDADVGEADAEDTRTDTDGGQSDVDGCVPKTTCEADECGVVDDGCGGTLECEQECPCQEGTTQEFRCGPCGLGQRICNDPATEEPLTGFGICGTTDLPGLSEESTQEQCEETLIFVSSSYQGAESSGTRAEPYKDLSRAMQEASTGDIIALAGTHEVAWQGLQLKEGVHIVGGFIPTDDFVYGADINAKSNLNANETTGEPLFGVVGDGITDRTVVANLNIRTASLSGESGESNYGVHLSESTGVELVNVNVEAGKGAAGASGAAGADGEDGGNGESHATQDVRADPPSGGANPDCSASNGGEGGMKAIVFGSVLQATAGGPSVGGISGGDAGQSSGANSLRAGEDGVVGPDGGDGVDGAGGAANFRIEDGLWVSEGEGEDGTDGDDGLGGGGGGGSGLPGQTCSGEDYFGANGGAGGAGGCGGAAGEGGKPGGGSFGLFLYRSDVLLEDVEISTDFGGRGGDGGAAGNGGAGGAGSGGLSKGAIATNQSGCVSVIDLPYSSGDGGDGGQGGDGGAGGGGAGGPSYGIFCERSSAEERGEVDITTGGAAFGGDGGTSGNNGASGGNARREGCD
jgi:hypothetical protein